MKPIIELLTPGKWNPHRDAVINENGVIVATTSGRFLPSYEERTAETFANAKIMASSKEMVGHLKKMVRLVDLSIEWSGGFNEFFECDHSVGICSCAERTEYEDAKEFLRELEGEQNGSK